MQLANNKMVQYHHHLVSSVEDTPKQSTLYQHRKALFPRSEHVLHNSMFLCVLPYFAGLFSSFHLVELCPFCWLTPSWGCGWAAGWADPEAAADDSDSLPELALVCALRSWNVKAHKNIKDHHQGLRVYSSHTLGIFQKRPLVPNIIYYTKHFMALVDLQVFQLTPGSIFE